MNQSHSFADSSYDGDSEKPRVRQQSHRPSPVTLLLPDDMSTTSSMDDDVTATSSAAIHVAHLQASFAEQTAAEMKEIVDSYANQATEAGPDSPPTAIRSQRVTLTSNTLAFPYDEEDSEEVNSPRRNLNSTSLKTPPKRGIANEFPSRSSSTDGVYNATPSLAISPTAESPNHGSTSKQAKDQHNEVNHMIWNTKHMAAIVSEYDRSSSSGSEDRIAASKSRRRRLAATIRRASRFSGWTWLLTWVVMPGIIAVLAHQLYVVKSKGAIPPPPFQVNSKQPPFGGHSQLQQPRYEVSESRSVTRCRYVDGEKHCEKEEYTVSHRG